MPGRTKKQKWSKDFLSRIKQEIIIVFKQIKAAKFANQMIHLLFGQKLLPKFGYHKGQLIGQNGSFTLKNDCSSL